MINILYGWLIIGTVVIIGNLYLYFGNTSLNQKKINNYLEKYEILDEKKLLNLEYLFQIINGCVIFLAGVIHSFHNSQIVSFFIFVLSLTVNFIWFYNHRKKFISRKG